MGQNIQITCKNKHMVWHIVFHSHNIMPHSGFYELHNARAVECSVCMSAMNIALVVDGCECSNSVTIVDCGRDGLWYL